MEWITSPEAWIALATLTALEIVLGVDNIIFISVLAGQLPQAQRSKARVIGLALAMITRSGAMPKGKKQRTCAGAPGPAAAAGPRLPSGEVSGRSVRDDHREYGCQPLRDVAVLKSRCVPASGTGGMLVGLHPRMPVRIP